MRKFFRGSLFIAVLLTIFITSGCVCSSNKNFWERNVVKGAAIGIIPGAVAGYDDENGESEDNVILGVAAGALIGGLIGALFDVPCEPERVKALEEPVDTDSDGDGVIDRLDQCPGTPAREEVDYKGCPKPKDSDGDGVYDNRDQCPGTPKGVRVNSSGCPLDSDKDGVYDFMDECPGTPYGVKVSAAGCPLDSDKDGVPDADDQCPKTPADAKVNSAGCWVLSSVLFDLNKATIKADFYPDLDNIVNILNREPEMGIEFEGHTCNIGSDAYNMKLSEKRAAAVKNYVISKGIDSSRVSAKGYGETKPVESNDTEAGRKANRRVQITPIW